MRKKVSVSASFSFILLNKMSLGDTFSYSNSDNLHILYNLRSQSANRAFLAFRPLLLVYLHSGLYHENFEEISELIFVYIIIVAQTTVTQRQINSLKKQKNQKDALRAAKSKKWRTNLTCDVHCFWKYTVYCL